MASERFCHSGRSGASRGCRPKKPSRSSAAPSRPPPVRRWRSSAGRVCRARRRNDDFRHRPRVLKDRDQQLRRLPGRGRPGTNAGANPSLKRRSPVPTTPFSNRFVLPLRLPMRLPAAAFRCRSDCRSRCRSRWSSAAARNTSQKRRTSAAWTPRSECSAASDASRCRRSVRAVDSTPASQQCPSSKSCAGDSEVAHRGQSRGRPSRVAVQSTRSHAVDRAPCWTQASAVSS